jgi:hypothetical protein
VITNQPSVTTNFRLAHLALGTKPLFDGVSALTVELQAPPDRQYIKAVYSGDNSFNGCMSPEIVENFE